MKYYIATSLKRMEAHNIVRDGLYELGYSITYDWTTHGSVKDTSVERLQEVAMVETGALDAADFVVALLPGGYGTHVEIGYTLGNGKSLFLHSEDPATFQIGPQANAFYHHTNLTQIVCPLTELAERLEEVLPTKSRSI